MPAKLQLMKTDIIFPNNNEREFAQIAEKLGYEQLIFVYRNNIPKLNDVKTSINIIQRKSTNFIVEGNDKLRYYLESTPVKIVYSLENRMQKDFIHQKASGLNHILCKIAQEKGKTIGFSFSQILNSNGIEQARIIGRIKQNIILCRKYKTKMFIGSFACHPFEMRAVNDLQDFFKVIGMTGMEVKEGVQLKLL